MLALLAPGLLMGGGSTTPTAAVISTPKNFPYVQEDQIGFQSVHQRAVKFVYVRDDSPRFASWQRSQ